MIFETLAAQADWLNDRSHNFNSSEAQAKTVLDDYRDGNADGVVNDVTNGGTLFIENEVLTIGSRTITNDKTAVYDNYLVGMQDKTPRKVLEDDIDPDKFSF